MKKMSEANKGGSMSERVEGVAWDCYKCGSINNTEIVCACEEDYILTSKSHPNIKAVLDEEKTKDRWGNGIEHHPKSKELMAFLVDIDFNVFGDHFCWKTGGDGDNGESLMYEMDAFFEAKDKGVL